MPNRTLTDKFVRSLKPAPEGTRIDHWDKKVPGFGVRVSASGHKAYIVYARWPAGYDDTGKLRTVPARRTVGNADKMTLASARQKAKAWLDTIESGVDPHEQARKEGAEQARREREEKRRRENTFEKVAESWFKSIKAQRKAREVERDVRRVFLPPWAGRPVTEITTADIEGLIADRAAATPAHARNLLGYATRMFKWAVRQRRYGLEKSPAADLSMADLIGKKNIGTRILADAELRALWRALPRLRTERTRGFWFSDGYPYYPLFLLLLLTGQRKSEVACARWREFDLDKRLWIIPAERMKMGAEHVVPLTDEMIAVLRALPRFDRTKEHPDGDYLFSTTDGEKPVNGFGKVKRGIDRRMVRTLRALARARGETAPPMQRWTIHDIRRTMRTNLSALPIPGNVAELMIAHAQPGLHQVYDRYSYVEEKRRGFELWSAHLRSIVQPSPANVIPLQGRRA